MYIVEELKQNNKDKKQFLFYFIWDSMQKIILLGTKKKL